MLFASISVHVLGSSKDGPWTIQVGCDAKGVHLTLTSWVLVSLVLLSPDELLSQKMKYPVVLSRKVTTYMVYTMLLR